MIVVFIDALFWNSFGLFLKLKEDLWFLLEINHDAGLSAVRHADESVKICRVMILM